MDYLGKCRFSMVMVFIAGCVLVFFLLLDKNSGVTIHTNLQI